MKLRDVPLNKRILILLPLLFISAIFLSITDLRQVERIIVGGERIRYIGIDTSEMRPEKPFAKEATEFNAILVDGREVRFTVTAQWDENITASLQKRLILK